jgi:hypothetical protein
MPSFFAIIGRFLALEFVEEGELRAGNVLYLFAEAPGTIEVSAGGTKAYLFSGMASATRKFPSELWVFPVMLPAIVLGKSPGRAAGLEPDSCNTLDFAAALSATLQATNKTAIRGRFILSSWGTVVGTNAECIFQATLANHARLICAIRK